MHNQAQEISGIQSDQLDVIFQKSEQQFRRLLDKLPAGAYTCNPNGLITYYNQHAEQLWGRSPKLHDPIDRYCGSFKLYSADSQPITHDKCWMALAIQLQKEFNGEEIIVERPNGERLNVLAYANPIHDDSGKLIGAVNVLVDISERKRAETEIETLNEQLQRAMTETHHRVKNNLQIISALVDMLISSGQQSVPASDMVRIAHHIRGLGILHDMLTHQSKSGREAKELSIAEALDQLLPILSVMTAGRTIKSDVKDAKLPIKQATSLAILVNELVSNATKHGKGDIAISFEVIDNVAALEVSDDGEGFPTDFDPKSAAHTGLELIERIGRWDLRGETSYTNRPAGGSCVRVWFAVGAVE